jgi:hypothetical protein
MITIRAFDIELTNNGRKGSKNRQTGVRALVRAADEPGPYGVVLYPTTNKRIDEARAEVLTGCWDDLADACDAAREALQARKRAGS